MLPFGSLPSEGACQQASQTKTGIPFPGPSARMELSALNGICNLQFLHNIVSRVSRWMRQEWAGRKLRERNIISNSFMIYLFAPCDCRGICNYAARWSGCAQCCMPWSSEQLPSVNLSFAGGLPPFPLRTSTLDLWGTQQEDKLSHR